MHAPPPPQIIFVTIAETFLCIFLDEIFLIFPRHLQFKNKIQTVNIQTPKILSFNRYLWGGDLLCSAIVLNIAVKNELSKLFTCLSRTFLKQKQKRVTRTFINFINNRLLLSNTTARNYY